MNRNKLIVGVLVLATCISLLVLVSQFVSPEYFESQKSSYQQFYHENPLLVVVIYVIGSAILIGAALPVTGILVLMSGALFGLPVGIIASALATTIGSIIGFLWSRYLLKEMLQRRYKHHFDIINRGIQKEGGYYVFSIRLFMIFPYFLVNLLCGVTDIKLRTYTIATLLGQLIVASIWVYAGSQLARIDSAKDILSPQLIISLGAVGLAPLLLNRTFGWIQSRRRLKNTEA